MDVFTLILSVTLAAAGWIAGRTWERRRWTANPHTRKHIHENGTEYRVHVIDGTPITLQDWQLFVGRWSVSTFPDATPTSQLNHLNREVQELQKAEAGWEGNPKASKQEAAQEAADCALLLFGYAHRRGFDLEAAALEKHRANQRRDWGPPDEDGVSEHVTE